MAATVAAQATQYAPLAGCRAAAGQVFPLTSRTFGRTTGLLQSAAEDLHTGTPRSSSRSSAGTPFK